MKKSVRKESMLLENLKAHHSASQSEDCPPHLKLDAAEEIAKAFPEIVMALEESVKLQSHYADQLNMHDGGNRIGFKCADEWIVRLREVEKLKG